MDHKCFIKLNKEHIDRILFQLFKSILHCLALLEFQGMTENIPCHNTRGNHFVHKLSATIPRVNICHF